MLFDFQTFEKLTKHCYPEDHPYSLDEVLGVFRYYFEAYEQHFDRPHPNISMKQIRHIIQIMPFVTLEDRDGQTEDIPAEVYEDLIDCHFSTRYHRCDYNINHFFSGRIREYRFFEVFF